MVSSKLQTIEDLLRNNNTDGHYEILQAVKKWVENIWEKNNPIPEQVWHGMEHINAMLGYADIIVFDYAEETFKEKELFLLLASVYLHDIGIYYGWKKFADVKGTQAYLSYDERLLIREKHHTTSGDVLRSFNNNDENIPDSLKNSLTGSELKAFKDMLEILAFICESHKSDNLYQLIEENQNNKNLYFNLFKVDLIAALLQLCDILHMDNKRINNDIFKDNLSKYLKGEKIEVELKKTDWIRFFRSHYIEKVNLEKKEKRIDISVKCLFNKADVNNDGIINSFKKIYENRLKRRKPDCLTILEDIKYG